MGDLTYLWKDRRRVLGMPITFTKYAISEDRLFFEKGLLNLRQEELLLYRIRDISLKITFGQRIFGVGSVLVLSSDQSTPAMELKNIKRPRRVKELLHQQVEQAKLQRRMRLGELVDSGHGSGAEMDPEDQELIHDF